MIITRKHLSRRTFLRGTGVVIGLPLLNSMVPALAMAEAAKTQSPLRLCYVYVPNGMVMPNFTPATVGRDFAFTPILKPLEKFRDYTTVLSGLDARNANPLGAGPGDHARASGAFLTGAHVRESGSDLYAGISADQLAAKAIGDQTRLPSLELGLEDTRVVGLCDSAYSCAYTSTISWSSSTTPLPPVTNPRNVFERLFGAADRSLSPEVAAQRARYRKSILDGAIEETRRLSSTVNSADRNKIDEYLTTIREIESRIQRAEKDGPGQAPTIEKPTGVPADYAEHTRLMFDLQALAFKADLTRVSTMMIGRESSIRAYDQIGINESHHQISHHRNDPTNIEKLIKIQIYHMSFFAEFIDKLNSTMDGEASLLDRSMIVYGGAIADSNKHIHEKLPILLMGKGLGEQKSGQHIQYADGTPLTNLHMTLLNRMGVRPESIGDSTGLLEI